MHEPLSVTRWDPALAAGIAFVVGCGCTVAVMLLLGRRRDEGPRAVAASSSAPPAVFALIEIRDHLFVEGGGGPPSAAVIKALYARLGAALYEFGVETIEGRGHVDWSTQEAVGTVATPDPALDQTVAATVRPGYACGGVLLRPQQVVVYAGGTRR